MGRMLDNQPKKIFHEVAYPSITDGVMNQIFNSIRTDVISPGEKLPSENDLADQMGVSRNTVREAINTLIEKENSFPPERGWNFRYTSVRGNAKTNLSNMMGTSNLIASQKKMPGQRDFSYRYELPSKHIAESLQIPETDEVIHISRVRTANGVSVIDSEEYFSANIPGLDHDLAYCEKLDNWSIYDYFQKANYSIQSVITHVHAISADKEMSIKLSVEENSPLLCLEQIHFSNTYPSPLLFCINNHNDKIINIMLVRSI